MFLNQPTSWRQRLFIIIIICVCVHLWCEGHTPWCACWGQRTTLWSSFSFLTLTWLRKHNSGLQDYLPNILSNESSHRPQVESFWESKVLVKFSMFSWPQNLDHLTSAFQVLSPQVFTTMPHCTFFYHTSNWGKQGSGISHKVIWLNCRPQRQQGVYAFQCGPSWPPVELRQGS